MATKATTRKATKQAPAPQAPTPVAAPLGAKAKAAAVIAANPTAKHAGFALAVLPAHVAQMGSNTGTLHGAKAQAVLVLGKPYKVRTNHTAAWAQQALAMAAKGAQAQAIVAAGVPAHFVAYCVRSGWLMAKPAKA